MPKHTRPFQVLLTSAEHDDLAMLAYASHLGLGAYVRALLRAAGDMTLRHTPKCASGIACFVPHLHPVTVIPPRPLPTPPAPTTELPFSST